MNTLYLQSKSNLVATLNNQGSSKKPAVKTDGLF